MSFSLPKIVPYVGFACTAGVYAKGVYDQCEMKAELKKVKLELALQSQITNSINKNTCHRESMLDKRIDELQKNVNEMKPELKEVKSELAKWNEIKNNINSNTGHRDNNLDKRIEELQMKVAALQLPHQLVKAHFLLGMYGVEADRNFKDWEELPLQEDKDFKQSPKAMKIVQELQDIYSSCIKLGREKECEKAFKQGKLDWHLDVFQIHQPYKFLPFEALALPKSEK